MKKTVLTILMIALVFTSCTANKNVDASMLDLSETMLSSSDFGDMSYASSEDKDKEKLLKNVSDISYSKVEKFFISYATDGSKNADEIVVIQTKSVKDAQEAKDSLKKHLEYRKSLYAVYGKSQSAKLLKAKVITYKNIACLISADDVEAVENAFYNYLKS